MPKKKKAFKIPERVLSPHRKRKGSVAPKPDNITIRIPSFSVKGMLIQGKPVGSTLEWNVAAALDELEIGYKYQVSVFGGRRAPGGAVIDFEAFTYPQSTYIFAQGGYWHTRGNKEEKDAWLIARIETKLHKRVVEIWEDKALTVSMAMIELRKLLRV